MVIPTEFIQQIKEKIFHISISSVNFKLIKKYEGKKKERKKYILKYREVNIYKGKKERKTNTNIFALLGIAQF